MRVPFNNGHNSPWQRRGMVRPLRFILLASLLAATALAGCGSKNGSETVDGTTGFSTETVDVKPTDTTGIIHGVVVDSAIRPIAGALLTVQTPTGPKMTNSTASGAFGFQDLKPGTYFVKATKGGFLSIQASAEVKAGEADPPKLKIQMETDASYVKPFFQKHSFNGYVECGVNTPAAGVALCAIPNNSCLPDPVFGIVCVTKTPQVTNDQFSNFIELDTPPTFIQGELIWESTQQAGNSLRLLIRTSTPELHADGFYQDDLNATEGVSPLLFKVDKAMVDGGKLGSNGTGLELDVFTAAGVCDPAGQGACAGGATIQQTFQIVTHIFYGFRPDPSYRFSEHGDPVAPK